MAEYRQSEMGSKEVFGKQLEIELAIAIDFAVIRVQFQIEEQYYHSKNRNKSINKQKTAKALPTSGLGGTQLSN